MANIKVHLYYLISHINQKHFKVLKSIFCIEKSVISQVNIFNKSIMT